MRAQKEIYLVLVREIVTGKLEIVTTIADHAPGTAISYQRPAGEFRGYVVATIRTELDGDVHNWLRLALGQEVRISELLNGFRMSPKHETNQQV